MDVIVYNLHWTRIEFSLDPNKDFELKNHYGIYQIYGYHPAYGENVLLYIGKAEDQTLGQRLSGRWEFIESNVQPKYIHLGTIVSDNEQELDRKVIGEIEKLLITYHTPALNQQNNKGLMKEINYHFMVINWGDFGKISPEASTLRCSYHFWNYTKQVTFKNKEESVNSNT